jgi:uncharacterized protein (TIGR01619 family)
MSYIRLYLSKPNDEGLSTQEEYDTLCNIEDALDDGLTKSGDVVYVGRNTSDGCRDFYFYTSEPSTWSNKVKSIMSTFPSYEYDEGDREDKDWEVYFNFLYPTARDWETIQSRRVCDNLNENGDSLSEKRVIDHWINFHNEAERTAFEKEAISLNYQVRTHIEEVEGEYSIGIQLYHTDIPSPYVSLELFDLAHKHNGDYSGWETAVIT